MNDEKHSAKSQEKSFRIIAFSPGIHDNFLSLQDAVPPWNQNGVPPRKDPWGSSELLGGEMPKTLSRSTDPIHHS